MASIKIHTHRLMKPTLQAVANDRGVSLNTVINNALDHYLNYLVDMQGSLTPNQDTQRYERWCKANGKG